MAIISPLPNNIVDGTTIDAVPVMGNFNAIVSNVNASAAPLASPTFSGTVTGPDAGTWSSSGFSNTVIATGTLNFLTLLEKAGIAQATGPAGQLPGTATNDSASAGNVGEYMSNSPSAVGSITSGQNTQIASLTLTAGDWDVWGNNTVSNTLGGTITQVFCFINTTNSFVSLDGSCQVITGISTTITNPAAVLGALPKRYQVATTQVVNLYGAIVSGNTASMTMQGFLAARRVR